jgi:mevalonate kinase
MKSFETTVCGKWILAGEHVVLRGGKALVFPLLEKNMRFHWIETESEFSAELEGERGQELSLIFYGLLEEALKKVGRSRADLQGCLRINSNLRLGAGLGASAALCVGVTRFFQKLGWVAEQDLYEFARSLENLFHGESSGGDIAISLRGSPLIFQRGGDWQDIPVHWQPHWYLSYSGKRGVTAECVKKVKDFAIANPSLAEKVDREMLEATEMALRALGEEPTTGFPLLARALDRGRDAFFQWGLSEGALGDHLRDLQKRGAIAVKPTGSGGGGYVLSLWEKPQNDPELISLPVLGNKH